MKKRAFSFVTILVIAIMMIQLAIPVFANTGRNKDTGFIEVYTDAFSSNVLSTGEIEVIQHVSSWGQRLTYMEMSDLRDVNVAFNIPSLTPGEAILVFFVAGDSGSYVTEAPSLVFRLCRGKGGDSDVSTDEILFSVGKDHDPANAVISSKIAYKEGSNKVGISIKKDDGKNEYTFKLNALYAGNTEATDLVSTFTNDEFKAKFINSDMPRGYMTIAGYERQGADKTKIIFSKIGKNDAVGEKKAEETAAKEVPATEAGNAENPKTSDSNSIQLFSLMVVVSLVTLAYLGYIRKCRTQQ